MLYLLLQRGVGKLTPQPISRKPAITQERDTQNQNNTTVRQFILKLLGLSSLSETIQSLRKEMAELRKEVENSKETVQEALSNIENFDADEFVMHSDLDDNIETYLLNNDYVTQSYCDDEIERQVTDAVEAAIDDADIEEKVRDLFNDASPAPMSEEDIKKEVSEAVKVTLEKMVKALADQQ